MGRTLTIIDRLLIAAHQIEARGRSPFSAEDLVVEAWNLYPDVFGLSGHNDKNGKPKYPDSNRVYAEIMGSKPIRKRGLLTKVGKKMYRLTDAGKSRARDLDDVSDYAPTMILLPRDTQNEIRRLMDSRAAIKVRSGKFDDLNFHDASAFWGISPRSNAKDLWERFSHTESVINSAIEATKDGGVSMKHGGIPYTADDMEMINRVHGMLVERFEAELTYIKERTDERKL